MNNISNLVEKCRAAVEKFGFVTTNKTTDKKSDLECLSASLASIQNEVRELTREIGNASGSVSYLVSEYGDLLEKVSNVTKDNQRLAKEVEKFNFQLSQTEKQQDSHQQYDRSRNLEIHGIPKLRSKSTNGNQIIKTVAKSLNVHLDDSHISTSHRLRQSDKAFAAGYPITQQQQSRIKARQQPPSTIIQFTNRDKTRFLEGENCLKEATINTFV